MVRRGPETASPTLETCALPGTSARNLQRPALTTTPMAKKIALLFAGQGAQCVGMGRDLAERYPVAADLFRKADELLGRNLCDIAWNGPMEELTKTSNCQPALYVHALAALAALREGFGEFEVGGAAGLSLGEI